VRVKIVVRILSGEGALLGWAPLTAAAPGDQTLRATHPCVVTMEAPGRAEIISYHWADLHVQSRVPFPLAPVDVTPGMSFTLEFPDGVVFRFPTDEGPLPAVTVRGAVLVGVPAGGIGSTGG